MSPLLGNSRLRGSRREFSYIQGFYSTEHFPQNGERQRNTVGGDNTKKFVSLDEGRGSSDAF